jgi:hypothetical protein
LEAELNNVLNEELIGPLILSAIALFEPILIDRYCFTAGLNFDLFSASVQELIPIEAAKHMKTETLKILRMIYN